MIMWIAAIVLVALCVGIGYRQGATRAAFTLVGIVLGMIFALPLAGAFRWVFPLIGMKSPVYADFGSPIIAFAVVCIAVKAIGQFVHRKVDYHYRYHRDDATRAVWEMMHRRVGACVGAFNGLLYFLVLAVIVSVFGYFTIQTGAGENGSTIASFFGKAAVDAKETKVDKAVAAFTPGSEKYHDAADAAGLLFHNRALVDRLYNYPVFASLAEEPPFKQLGSDRDVQSMIRGQTTLNEILANPKIQDVVSNTDIATRVLDLDFKDLKSYLETGKSEKYAVEPIVGRWSFNEVVSLQLSRAAKPDITASTYFRLKNEITERFDGSVFTAFYDNKVKLALATNMENRGSPMTAAGRLPNGQTNFVARWLSTNALASMTGKWSGKAPTYMITVGNRGGSAEGRLENDRLSFQFDGKVLAFTKLPD
jgi:hypothetical protein